MQTKNSYRKLVVMEDVRLGRVKNQFKIDDAQAGKLSQYIYLKNIEHTNLCILCI